VIFCRKGILLKTAFSVLLLVAFAGCANNSNQPATLPAKGVFDVRDYGAVGDGVAMDTKAIQAAIDACTSANGGKVYLHNGKFLSGTLRLKSNVTLYIEAGAELLGSTNLADYPVIIEQYRSYADNYRNKSLIYAEKAEDIAIMGRGTIDGQGVAFEGPWQQRPYVIRIGECKNVLTKDVTLKNSAMWMQHYVACDKVRIQGIRVWNHCNRNNDMLDIDSCRDVIVSDCIGDSDDDAIVLKSTSARPCENVTITNCLLSSHCNAIKMGTESHGGFKNITISNCTITVSKDDTVTYGQRNGLAGIALEIVDGGTLENISISNINIIDITVPVFLRLGNRGRIYKEGIQKPDIGQFRNVQISNILATGADSIGCSITGLPNHPIENVTLTNIKMTFKGGGTVDDAQRKIPELADKYPEGTMFGTLPAYGFYCRHVTNLKFNNIDLGFETEDHRPPLVFDDVKGLQICTLNAKAKEAAKALIWLKNVKDFSINNCQPPENIKTFIDKF
jgi:hypothetical protein